MKKRIIIIQAWVCNKQPEPTVIRKKMNALDGSADKWDFISEIPHAGFLLNVLAWNCIMFFANLAHF